jgi:hypothetical protein
MSYLHNKSIQNNYDMMYSSYLECYQASQAQDQPSLKEFEGPQNILGKGIRLILFQSAPFHLDALLFI